YIGGKAYQLYMRFIVDERDPQFVQFYYKWVTIFSLVTLAVTLLLCWRKNVLNKAKYAFEDYQRDLTDSLAHDIKTPLMAISGYTENVMSGKLTDEEQKEYLTAILDNVSFTDRLISRTLYLNHADKSKSKPEPIKLADMTEEMLGKYAPMLREKKITYGVNGNAEIKADKTAMETIMENLISNAVKYTPNGGTVKIEIDKKHLTITNSVTERIDTKELKRPFVRGDQARSNADGNGLGLAIAERAALSNGFKLTLSCTETEFKTELIRR
ncbi:MAG: HAMP domain-containing histidine kinase, partial [Ruminococcus sp.]|nr:HAMP domain-containing histidine kinase [Ruminococcus sp.]